MRLQLAHGPTDATQSAGSAGDPVAVSPTCRYGSKMRNTIQSFIIVGVTQGGKTFRPSDWADRLCGVMSAFGADNRMTYSPYVRPGCSLKGDKTVLVDARIHDIEPLAYNFLVNFAKDNDLQMDYLAPGESL